MEATLAFIYLPHIGYGNPDKMKEPQQKQLACQNETRVSAGNLDDINFINDESKLTALKTKSIQAISIPQLLGRVLLAEDSQINQKLLAMYVNKTGAEIIVVDNGRLAVEKALAGDFDLILMDIQMPLMDGMKATEILRKTGYSRPVIALTANTLEGEQDKYDVIGFNSCLSKPIDHKLFFTTLARYLNSDDIKARYEQAQKVEVSSDYAKLASDFESSLPGVLTYLKKAVKEERWENFAKQMHILKGSGGSFGYPEITNSCSKIESFLKAGDYYVAAAMLTELERISQSIFKSKAI